MSEEEILDKQTNDENNLNTISDDVNKVSEWMKSNKLHKEYLPLVNIKEFIEYFGPLQLEEY